MTEKSFEKDPPKQFPFERDSASLHHLYLSAAMMHYFDFSDYLPEARRPGSRQQSVVTEQ